MQKSASPRKGGKHSKRKAKGQRPLSLRETSQRFRLDDESGNRLIEETFVSIGTPVALSCYLLFKAGEHRQLVEKGVNPDHYLEAEDFRLDFLAISLLRKANFLKTGIDTRHVALEAFKTSEEACKVTNRRFKYLTLDPSYEGENALLLEALRREISEVLGPFRTREFFASGCWGPGATISIGGKHTCSSRKFSEERGISDRAYRLFGEAMTEAYPGWFTLDLVESLVSQNSHRIGTVPKNSRTDRTICTEPGLNMFLQKGAGAMIRTRLRKAGFDLNSVKSSHAGARKGSAVHDGALTGTVMDELATVDFSAASDSISSEVVRALLPVKWWLVLDALRCHSYTLPNGEVVPNAKFASMGNGFTFELESLIFVLAACVVCRSKGLPVDEIAVHGDDIIIPSRAFDAYQEFCSFLGFTVNVKKSYSQGCFREACGGYFFAGIDVKPFFLKGRIRKTHDLYTFLNALSRFACGGVEGRPRSARFKNVWKYGLRQLPSKLRLYGDVKLGDTCIHASFDEATPRRAGRGFEGFRVRCLTQEPVEVELDCVGVLLSRLNQVRGSPEFWRNPSIDGLSYGNSSQLRRVTRDRTSSVLVAQWYHLGAWSSN